MKTGVAREDHNPHSALFPFARHYSEEPPDPLRCPTIKVQFHSYSDAVLTALALVIAGCHSPARTIRPTIYSRPEGRYQAMKSAPVIVIAEVMDYKLITGPREVLDPGNALNRPRTIPLRLARISAN